MRRALRPGGRIAFFTIEFPRALAPAGRDALREVTPRATWARSPYDRMLAAAGYVDIGERDVSAEYAATASAWVRETLPHLREIGEIDGHEATAERVASWKAAAEAVTRGELSRTLYWARRPRSTARKVSPPPADR